MVKHLPLAQAVISRSWDGAPRQALCLAGSLLLPLPLPPLLLSLYLCASLCLSVSQMNKENLKKNNNKVKKMLA